MVKKAAAKSEKYSCACVSCGILIKEGEERFVDGKYTCAKCAVIPRSQPVYFIPPMGALRIISYIVCLLSPAAGFVLGALSYAQKDAENSKFARMCFIFAGIGLALLLMFLAINAVWGVFSEAPDTFKPRFDFYFEEGYY